MVCQMSIKVARLKIEIFEGENSICTTSYIDEKPCGTVHLEKMINGKFYDININGKTFNLMLYQSDHLLIIEK